MVTTTKPKTYNDYLDRLRAKDPSVLLGSLVWYTVSEAVRIKHAALLKTLEAVGLEEFVPPVPRDDDVFRRVASAQERKRVETDNPDVFENYLIRDVARTGGRVVKQIVVERVNGKGSKLSYSAAVELVFTAKGSTIETATLGRVANEQAENLAELIKRDFARERKTINAYGIRELMRKIIIEAGATIVRPTGGVYFLMEKSRPTVDALVALAGELNGVTFHPVPLINDAEQQAMLRDAVEAETRTEIAKRLDEIDKLMEGSEIPASQYQRMVDEMNAIKARAAEYRDVLDDTLAGVDLLVGSYDAKMRKLFLHVDAVVAP